MQDLHLSKLGLIWSVNSFDQRYTNNYCYHDIHFSQINLKALYRLLPCQMLKQRRDLNFWKQSVGQWMHIFVTSNR